MEAEKKHDKELIARINAQTAASKAYTEKYIGDSEKQIAAAQKVEKNAVRATQYLNSETEKAVQANSNVGVSLSDLAGPASVALGAMAAIAAAEASLAIGTFELGKHAADYGDAIYKAGVKTGLSADFLSVAKLKTEEAGKSFEGFTQSLARAEIALSKSISQPSGEAAQAFKILKLNVDELKKSSPTEAIMAVFKALSQVDDVYKRNRIAQDLLSKGGIQYIGVLEDLGQHFGELHEKTEALGLLWDGNMAKAAHDFNIQLADLDLKAKGFVITLGQKIIPALGELIGVFDDTTKSAGGLAGILGGALSFWIHTNTDALKDYIAGFETLAAVMGSPSLAGSALQLFNSVRGGFDHVSAGGDLGNLPSWMKPNDRDSVDFKVHTPKERTPKKTPEDFGIDLYEQLLRELESVNIKTKEEATVVELTKKKYDGLTDSVRGRVLAAAKQLDTETELKKIHEAEKKFVEELQSANRAATGETETWTQKLNALILKEHEHGTALDAEREKVLRATAAFLDQRDAIKDLTRARTVAAQRPRRATDGTTDLGDGSFVNPGDTTTRPRQVFGPSQYEIDQLNKYRNTVLQIKDGFENAFTDAFSHINEGFGAVLKTMLLDFTKFLAEMIIKAEAAKLATKIFGDPNSDSDSGGSSGGASGSGWLGKILKIGMNAGAAGSSSSSSGGFGGSSLGDSFGGFGASGGDFAPNTWAIVGENGPEAVQFGSSGARVYSNPDTSKMIGGHTFNFTVYAKDANSFNSPQTKQQIQVMILDAATAAGKRAR